MMPIAGTNHYPQLYYVVSLQIPNAGLYAEENRSLVLLFITLPLLFIKKDSRKRCFLKSVSNV